MLLNFTCVHKQREEKFNVMGAYFYVIFRCKFIRAGACQMLNAADEC